MSHHHEYTDAGDEGKKQYFLDIDRMVNEGLGGGRVTSDNGLIEQDVEVAREAAQQINGREAEKD